MNKKLALNSKHIAKNYQSLPQSSNFLLITTISLDGIPYASYIPYVQVLGDYFIFINDRDLHAENISKLGQISIVFENKERSKLRPTKQCNAQRIHYKSDLYWYIATIFDEKFSQSAISIENKRSFRLIQIV